MGLGDDGPNRRRTGRASSRTARRGRLGGAGPPGRVDRRAALDRVGEVAGLDDGALDDDGREAAARRGRPGDRFRDGRRAAPPPARTGPAGPGWIACVSSADGRRGAPARGGSPVIRNARVGSSAQRVVPARRQRLGDLLAGWRRVHRRGTRRGRPPAVVSAGWLPGPPPPERPASRSSSAGASAGRRRGKGWLPRPNRVGGAARSPRASPARGRVAGRAGVEEGAPRRGLGATVAVTRGGAVDAPGRVAAGQPAPGPAWSVVGPAVANGVNRDGRPVRGNAPLPGRGPGRLGRVPLTGGGQVLLAPSARRLSRDGGPGRRTRHRRGTHPRARAPRGPSGCERSTLGPGRGRPRHRRRSSGWRGVPRWHAGPGAGQRLGPLQASAGTHGTAGQPHVASGELRHEPGRQVALDRQTRIDGEPPLVVGPAGREIGEGDASVAAGVIAEAGPQGGGGGEGQHVGPAAGGPGAPSGGRLAGLRSARRPAAAHRCGTGAGSRAPGRWRVARRASPPRPPWPAPMRSRPPPLPRTGHRYRVQPTRWYQDHNGWPAAARQGAGRRR